MNIDDENWKCFVNSTYSRDTAEWSVKKVKWVPLISKSDDEPPAMANMGPDL